MAIVHYPGEVKDFKMKAAEGLDREGLVLKIDNTDATDPRVSKVASSGDVIFGVGFADTYNQEGTLATGGQVGVVQEGEVNVAVEAATYKVGDAIYLATTDGHGVNSTSFDNTLIGICQEYKVVSSANVTNRVNQVRVKLTFTVGV